MCGLFASRDPEKLKELMKLNLQRGQKSLSQAGFEIDGIDGTGEIHGWKLKQEPKISLDEDILKVSDYTLVHIQAPTAVGNHIHPAVLFSNDRWNMALWHNGILKQEAIRDLQQELRTNVTWDTLLILMGYARLERSTNVEKSKFLSNLDGSFACFYKYGPHLYVFRNEIAPLFVDNELNFSSVKFKGSNSIEPGIVFKVNFNYNRLDDTGIHFTTANNPYIL